MPRPKLGPRVTGPYYSAARDRFRIFIYDGPRPQVLWFDTRETAEEGIRLARQQLTQPARRSLRDLLADYFAEKEQRGQAKPRTCAEQSACLQRFFAAHLDEDVGRLTPQRAAQLYLGATVEPTRRTGRPAEAATHRYYLALARGLFAWAVRRGYLGQNPFAAVQPVGRASVGKPQLRLDEARLYREAALRLFDEHDDRLALAAVMPLYLGLRASEVVERRVRDIDAGGTLLWIDRGKSKNARRHLAVKARPLQQRLARLTAGRQPDEALFALGDPRRPPCRQILNAAVRRVCLAAGVPVVCPHSLRGLWATLSVESGAAESAVAAALGHGSFEMTAKHYAQPEALAGARSRRVLDLLDAGEPAGTSDSGPDSGPDNVIDELTAEQLAAKLPPATLARLRELLLAMPAPPPALNRSKRPAPA